ncbi:hypothetical protein PCANC_23243 [Puccinia coronata f. sp. avenae]|uniref:Uncharacterized protein n=1 Tax=Puccinia coronata f. sp. avenae TaxID=200324 RepID=A0A2N5S7K7_9BASI|nr:hypothetical protein PCANC_23243 [Puccinia coronata f. sp. avenae]
MTPVYSPKNPPEEALTDAISQGPQGGPVKANSSSRWKHGPCLLDRPLQQLGALVSLAETKGFSRWNHWSQFARLTAPAAETIGLSFQDQWLQELKTLVSLAETDSSSCWENWSHLLRPTAPAVGRIGLSF